MPYRWTLTDLVAPYVGSEILTKDPIGWDEAIISVARSEQYKGMNTFYTNSLKFHCDGGGKEYIDAIYESEGIDGRINILIEYDCDGSGTYDTLFNGIINLASYKTDGEYTICNIEQSDLHTKLAMRDEISVDLETTTSIGGSPITAPDAYTLPMSSMIINYSDVWRINNEYTYNYVWSVGITAPFSTVTALSMVLDGAEINTATSISEGTFESTFLDPISPIVTFNDNTISYPLSVDYSIDWHGTFSDINSDMTTPRTTGSVKLILSYGLAYPAGTPTEITLFTQNFGANDNYNTSFDVVSSGTISINAGDNIWLNWVVTETPGTDVSLTWVYTAESLFTITTDTSYLPTTAKSMLIHEAFNQVVDAIADGDGHFTSDFYGRTDSQKISYAENGCGSQIALTNGLNIREFENKSIYASFRELFDAMDCIHNIGMGIDDNTVRIEPLSHWFDTATQIISLPNVNSYEQKCDNKRFINKIDIGYQKWESEFGGGLDDPNAKHEYSTIVSSIKNTYTKLCSYLASPYTIEFTRRKNKTLLATEDWRYDNDNFLIALANEYRGNVVFTASHTIRLDGLFYSFQVGDTILVEGTASNNGYYTITSVSQIINRTIIIVSGWITTETIDAVISDITNIIYRPELHDDAFTYGVGMTSLSTAYNLRLTPARMLLAHFNVIAAGLQIIGGAIKFVRGDGNTALGTSADVVIYTDGCQEEYKSQPLTESQNFQWNDSNVLNVSPLWLPETYSFEYPLSYTQFKAIQANPYGYVSFYKDSADVKTGFIMSMEYKLKTGLTKFELLRKA